jgi:hypothetical protein
MVTITPAQLGYLLEGIDWRMPQHTWRDRKQPVDCGIVNHIAIEGSQERCLVIPSRLMSAEQSLPDDVPTLKALWVTERAARTAAEAEARHRALLIEKLKYMIVKLRHARFGQSCERGALIEQLELRLTSAPLPAERGAQINPP